VAEVLALATAPSALVRPAAAALAERRALAEVLLRAVVEGLELAQE
jgi:hypothetical protein